MTEHPAAALARHLAARAEDVCRRYLPNGRRAGCYWQVGDVHNTQGASLYVRLTGPVAGKGAAGKWTDAATGEHGDLLDLIRLSTGARSLTEAMDHARAALALPRQAPRQAASPSPPPRASTEAARRLFAAGRPIGGTPAEHYLRARGISTPVDPALRFHPTVFYRARDDAPLQRLPAMLAPITDLAGRITGVGRTWIDAGTAALAAVPEPRRVIGHLLRHGVRFGEGGHQLVAGEGLETVLSVRSALPELPAVAALTANHLAALELPSHLVALWIAVDDDPAGWMAADRLRARAEAAGITVHQLVPRHGDFNDDLRRYGVQRLRAHLLQATGGSRLRSEPPRRQLAS